MVTLVLVTLERESTELHAELQMRLAQCPEVQQCSDPELFEGPGDEGEFHPVAVARTMYVDSIDRSAAETIVEQLQGSTAMIAVTQLRVLGGAASRVPVEATAYAHRQSRIMVNVAALMETPEQAPEHEPWVVGLADALRQDDMGAYVNFLATKARSESGPRTHGRPGTGSWRSSAATTRRTSSD